MINESFFSNKSKDNNSSMGCFLVIIIIFLCIIGFNFFLSVFFSSEITTVDTFSPRDDSGNFHTSKILEYAEKVFRGKIPEKETANTPWSKYNKSGFIASTRSNVNFELHLDSILSTSENDLLKVWYWIEIISPENEVIFSSGKYFEPIKTEWEITNNPTQSEWKLVSARDEL